MLKFRFDGFNVSLNGLMAIFRKMRAHGEKDSILTNNGRSRQIIADFKEKSPFQQIDNTN